MKLIKARVQSYRSVHDSDQFDVEPTKTLLVGVNEAGKTGILRALQTINPPDGVDPLEALKDYPRSRYSEIQSGRVDRLAAFTPSCPLVPIPLTGRRRSIRETTKTYAEARVALTKLQRQVDEDQQPKSTIRVRQAVEQWLEVAELGDTTRERYDDLIRLYVLPTLGEMQASNSVPSCWSASTRSCTGAAT